MTNRHPTFGNEYLEIDLACLCTLLPIFSLDDQRTSLVGPYQSCSRLYHPHTTQKSSPYQVHLCTGTCTDHHEVSRALRSAHAQTFPTAKPCLHIFLLLVAGANTLLDLPILCPRKPLINRNCLPSTSDHTSAKSVFEWLKIRVWVKMCSTRSRYLALHAGPALRAYSSTCQNTLYCPWERFYTCSSVCSTPTCISINCCTSFCAEDVITCWVRRKK
jgi:hypothetical protein